MRTSVRKVEEAIASGDKTAALAALKAAEPEIMRAAQKGVIHRNAANRKVSRLAHAAAECCSFFVLWPPRLDCRERAAPSYDRVDFPHASPSSGGA